MTFDNAEAWSLAALGSADAQMMLCGEAMLAGAASKVSTLEALVTAETLARLATASGDPVHFARLAGILFWRCQHAAETGDDERAYAYEIEATGLLAMADEMGCTDAGEILAAYSHLLRPETLATLASNRGLFMPAASIVGDGA